MSVTTTTQVGTKPAEVKTQTVGELLGLSEGRGVASPSVYAAHVVKGDASLPDAAFFTQGHHLLREYFLRSGEALPDATHLAANVSDGTQPLYALAGQYSTDPNAFNRKRAGEQFMDEARRTLLSGERSRAVAFWHRVQLGPYNFETGQFELCLFEHCRTPRDTALRFPYRTRDYALVVENVPAKLTFAPPAGIAEQIERAATMQSPRGMRALLIAELPADPGPTARGREVRGSLRAVFFYRREHFAETDLYPDPSKLLTAVAVPGPGTHQPSGQHVAQASIPAAHSASVKPVRDNVAKALPKRGPVRLSDADTKRIFALLGLKKTSRPGWFTDDSGCPPAQYVIEPADLNSDGQPEVFVSGGNACTAGFAGASLHLFVKDLRGHYQPNLGFPAGGYALLPSSASGYRDIRVGAGGFCDAVWRWNGAAYAHAADIATEPGGCNAVRALRAQ